MLIFRHVGVLHRIETVVSDEQMRLNSPPIDSPVAIVDIDDEDYQQLFGGSSPLNPPHLEKLISDIAKGRPRIIGVDIDTSDPQFVTGVYTSYGKGRLVRFLKAEQKPEPYNLSTYLGDRETWILRATRPVCPC
jgi:CHASE2 domain-containing sensor protein